MYCIGELCLTVVECVPGIGDVGFGGEESWGERIRST
jgi:hypothetical protein